MDTDLDLPLKHRVVAEEASGFVGFGQLLQEARVARFGRRALQRSLQARSLKLETDGGGRAAPSGRGQDGSGDGHGIVSVERRVVMV
jgi:hypothetical protein